jgi:hypothetical protein
MFSLACSDRKIAQTTIVRFAADYQARNSAAQEELPIFQAPGLQNLRLVVHLISTRITKCNWRLQEQ